MPLDRDQKRFIELGKALFGTSWQSPFARMTGLSRAYVQFLGTGKRPVTQTVGVAVIKGLRAEVDRLNAQAAKVKALSERYEAAVLTHWLPGE